MEAYSRARNKAVVPFQQSSKPYLGITPSTHTDSSVVVVELTGQRQHSARKQCMYPVAGRESGSHPLCRGTRSLALLAWELCNYKCDGGVWEPHKKESFTLLLHASTNPVMCRQDNRTSLIAALTQITFKCAISHPF